MYADLSFSIKFQVAGWKKSPVQMRYCEFCVLFEKDYLVERVQTVASNILGYPYVWYLLQGPYLGNSQFSPAFWHWSCQINSRVLHNLKSIFRTISNIYDEAFLQKYLTAFSRCIFVEMFHHSIRLCRLVFLYFSTFFVWILEWTIWTFCYY